MQPPSLELDAFGETAGERGFAAECALGRLMTSSRVKVIYVAGQGRGGSTLLGRMRGQIPSILMCGETSSLWRPDSGILRLEDLCECGAELGRCPPWGTLLEGVTGDG